MELIERPGASWNATDLKATVWQNQPRLLFLGLRNGRLVEFVASLSCAFDGILNLRLMNDGSAKYSERNDA
jgi:hypothetical protein